MKIRGECGPIEHFLSELKNMTQKLKGGHLKKCIAAKEAGYQKEARDDLHVVKNVPAVSRLQQGVRSGHAILRLIANRHCCHCDKGPVKVQGLAHVCAVGGAEYDAF